MGYITLTALITDLEHRGLWRRTTKYAIFQLYTLHRCGDGNDDKILLHLALLVNVEKSLYLVINIQEQSRLICIII